MGHQSDVTVVQARSGKSEQFDGLDVLRLKKQKCLNTSKTYLILNRHIYIYKSSSSDVTMVRGAFQKITEHFSASPLVFLFLP